MASSPVHRTRLGIADTLPGPADETRSSGCNLSKLQCTGPFKTTSKSQQSSYQRGWLTGVPAGQDQWCIVKVVANAAAGCAIKLRVNWAGAFWPRKLCVGFSISHFAQMRDNIAHTRRDARLMLQEHARQVRSAVASRIRDTDILKCRFFKQKALGVYGPRHTHVQLDVSFP